MFRRMGDARRRAIIAAVVTLATVSVAHADVAEGSHQLWEARYNGGMDGPDIGNSMAVSPDGSAIFVTGESALPGEVDDFVTLAYEADTGRPLWESRYDGPSGKWDEAFALAVSPDGSMVFVTGMSWGLGDDYDYATLAYSSDDGGLLWEARYDGPRGERAEDVPLALAVDPNGSAVFVTGYSYGLVFDGEFTTIAYSTASGTMLWEAREAKAPGEPLASNFPRAIGVSPDGSSVFVTGEAWRTDRLRDYATFAYSAATGERQWVAYFDGPEHRHDVARALAISPDGAKVFVTGASCCTGIRDDYLTIAYSAATGDEIWQTRYNGPANGRDDAEAIAVSPDGSKVFVTGEAQVLAQQNDYATLAYASEGGAVIWEAQYGGSYGDLPNAVAVGSDGSVYVTGRSAGPGGPDDHEYATLAYDGTTGRQRWAARYDGTSIDRPDGAEAVAVAPDGSKVFVTGGSMDANTWGDVATLAYRVTTCASGQDEGGPISGPIHEAEGSTSVAGPYVHGASCSLADAGL